MIELEVKALLKAASRSAAVLVLMSKDRSDKPMVLQMTIGIFEAVAIERGLQGLALPRPMTHDLLLNTIQQLGAVVDRVVVEGLEEGTYYASIFLRGEAEEEIPVDSRPSDAVALAIRVGAPIFAVEEVLEPLDIPLQEDASGERQDLGDIDNWRKWLDDISPKDFDSE